MSTCAGCIVVPLVVLGFFCWPLWALAILVVLIDRRQ